MSGTLTYTWTINNIKIQTSNEGTIPNAAYIVNWTKTGIDANGDSGSYIGETTFTENNVTPGTWLPYNELTESIVVNWVQNSLVNNVDVDLYIASQINNEENPITDPGPLPWANT